jgi:hypothetical protein
VRHFGAHCISTKTVVMAETIVFTWSYFRIPNDIRYAMRGRFDQSSSEVSLTSDASYLRHYMIASSILLLLDPRSATLSTPSLYTRLITIIAAQVSEDGHGRLLTGQQMVLCTKQGCTRRLHHPFLHLRSPARMADNVSMSVTFIDTY